MDACNHSTFSQEIVKCVSGVDGILGLRQQCIPRNSTAYLRGFHVIITINVHNFLYR